MSDESSGLELDTTRARPRKASAAAPVERAFAPPAVRPPQRRRSEADDDDVGTDSSTGGAFIVITLVHVLGGLLLATQAAKGDAVVMVTVAVLSALFTFIAYFVTGFLVHHFGIIALIFFGGWFSLLVGLAAQLAHQLLPWLGWKVLAIITAATFAIAFALDAS